MAKARECAFPRFAIRALAEQPHATVRAKIDSRVFQVDATLAAWAHAVADQPKVEPRRADKRGFWRGLFRIPAEVALVEYAHGAKIHRLLIEAGDDHLPDFI